MKPRKLTEDQVKTALSGHLRSPITDIEPITTGEITEAYFITAGEEALVARFAHPRIRDTLYKDHYVSRELVAPGIPVPEFIALADFAGGSLAITRRCPGQILDDLDEETHQALLPELVHILDQVHQSDISATSGYGSFDAEGRGRWSSWESFLLSVGEEETDELAYYGEWYSLFDEGILDRGFFFRLYDELKERVSDLPDIRKLIHADYGFDNVLADESGVTGVIDWANAAFGDFLLDVARMQLLQPERDWEGRFVRLYSDRDQDLPGYENRIWCCTCYMALDLLRFYAKVKRPDGYLWAKDKILAADALQTIR